MNLRRLPHSNSSTGYTLIELLAIVVIVAVLAAIAAPSWLAYATRQRINAVESDLVQVFKQAQETAVSQRRSVTVQIDEAAAFPTVVISSGGSTRTEVLGPSELRPDMVTLDVSTPTTGDEISFDYQGTARGSTVPFVVDVTPSTGEQRQCVIVASLLGNVKTSRSDADCDNPTL